MLCASRSMVTSKALRTGTGENSVRVQSASTFPLAIGAGPRAGRHEGGEQVVAAVGLRVPLDAEHPGPLGQFDRFDDAVLGPAARGEPLAEHADPLVVVRRDLDPRADQLGEAAV